MKVFPERGFVVVRSFKTLLNTLNILLIILILALFTAWFVLRNFFMYCCPRITTPCGCLKIIDAILYSSLKQLNETNSTLMSVRLEIAIKNICSDTDITVTNITVDGYPVLNFTPVSVKPREVLRLSYQVIPGSSGNVWVSPDLRVWVLYDPKWGYGSEHSLRVFFSGYERGKLIECYLTYRAPVVQEGAT